MKILIFIFIILIFIYTLFSFRILNTTISCKNNHEYFISKFEYEFDSNYKIINPSICKFNNNFILAFRFTNATYKNIALYLHHKLNYNSYLGIFILDNKYKIEKTIFPYTSSKYPIEDPRIIIFNEKIYISVTEMINSKYIYPYLLEYDLNLNFLRRIDYKNYFSKNKIQKNWCPFINNNRLLLHTDSYPEWIIYEIDLIDGSLKEIVRKNINIISLDKNSYLRCSTSWKIINNKYICGLHIKEYDKIIGRFGKIRTILLELDVETLLPIKKTDILCIDKYNHHLIQFLSGLEINNNDIILTYGLGDYKIKISTIPFNRLYKMLKEI
jgi:predicted GH43/DUF377 family glycosyl hydrolase